MKESVHIVKSEVASSLPSRWSFYTNDCTYELYMAWWWKGSYTTKQQGLDKAVVWGGLHSEDLAGMANLKQTYRGSRKCWKEYFFQLLGEHLGILPAGKKRNFLEDRAAFSILLPLEPWPGYTAVGDIMLGHLTGAMGMFYCLLMMFI